MTIEEKLKQQIKENDILIYMKGTPYEPQCGFSAKTVQALIECDAKFSYVDVIENNDVRATLPSVSDWPTFPQVFIKGELIGGADIVAQMHESGQEIGSYLQPAMKAALLEYKSVNGGALPKTIIVYRDGFSKRAV